MLTIISSFLRPIRLVASVAILGCSALTLAESIDNDSESFLLTDESIVFVYQSHSQEQTPEAMYAHAISRDFRTAKEEFTRYDIVQDLQPEIKERLREADEAKTFRVIVRGWLNEYDFDRKLFPIDLEGASDKHPRRIWFDQNYVAELLNLFGMIDLPVPFDSAKKLAGELQKSREVECVVIGQVKRSRKEDFSRTPPMRILSIEADQVKVRFTSGQKVGSLDLAISSS